MTWVWPIGRAVWPPNQELCSEILCRRYLFVSLKSSVGVHSSIKKKRSSTIFPARQSLLKLCTQIYAQLFDFLQHQNKYLAIFWLLLNLKYTFPHTCETGQKYRTGKTVRQSSMACSWPIRMIDIAQNINETLVLSFFDVRFQNRVT